MLKQLIYNWSQEVEALIAPRVFFILPGVLGSLSFFTNFKNICELLLSHFAETITPVRDMTRRLRPSLLEQYCHPFCRRPLFIFEDASRP